MRRFTILFSSALLLLVACANNQLEGDPKTALVSALRNLGESESQTTRLTLQSTSESLQALAAEGGGSLDATDAGKILQSSITISGTSADNPLDATSQIVVNVAGEDDLELRLVDRAFYVRADVRGLAETFGAPPGMVDQLAQGAQAAGLTFVQPALDGRWLSIEGFDQLLQAAGAQSAGLDQQRFNQELVKIVEQNATVTSEGEDDAGAHVVASLPLRQSYQQFVKAIATLGAPLPPGALPPASQLPNEDVNVDFWLSDDQVAQMELDLLQFARLFDGDVPEGAEQLALRVTNEAFDGEIEAPDDAVAVDPQQIFQTFLGGLGGSPSIERGQVTYPGGKGGGDGKFPCEFLKGEPKEVIAEFKEECPQLFK